MKLHFRIITNLFSQDNLECHLELQMLLLFLHLRLLVLKCCVELY